MLLRGIVLLSGEPFPPEAVHEKCFQSRSFVQMCSKFHNATVPRPSLHPGPGLPPRLAATWRNSTVQCEELRPNKDIQVQVGQRHDSKVFVNAEYRPLLKEADMIEDEMLEVYKAICTSGLPVVRSELTWERKRPLW